MRVGGVASTQPIGFTCGLSGLRATCQVCVRLKRPTCSSASLSPPCRLHPRTVRTCAAVRSGWEDLYRIAAALLDTLLSYPKRSFLATSRRGFLSCATTALARLLGSTTAPLPQTHNEDRETHRVTPRSPSLSARELRRGRGNPVGNPGLVLARDQCPGQLRIVVSADTA